jgi:hypothetical protein
MFDLLHWESECSFQLYEKELTVPDQVLWQSSLENNNYKGFYLAPLTCHPDCLTTRMAGSLDFLRQLRPLPVTRFLLNSTVSETVSVTRTDVLNFSYTVTWVLLSKECLLREASENVCRRKYICKLMKTKVQTKILEKTNRKR